MKWRVSLILLLGFAVPGFGKADPMAGCLVVLAEVESALKITVKLFDPENPRTTYGVQEHQLPPETLFSSSPSVPVTLNGVTLGKLNFRSVEGKFAAPSFRSAFDPVNLTQEGPLESAVTPARLSPSYAMEFPVLLDLPAAVRTAYQEMATGFGETSVVAVKERFAATQERRADFDKREEPVFAPNHPLGKSEWREIMESDFFPFTGENGIAQLFAEVYAPEVASSMVNGESHKLRFWKAEVAEEAGRPQFEAWVVEVHDAYTSTTATIYWKRPL